MGCSCYLFCQTRFPSNINMLVKYPMIFSIHFDIIWQVFHIFKGASPSFMSSFNINHFPPKLISQRSPCSVDRKIYTQKFRKQVIKSQHIIDLCYPSRMCAAWTCRHGKCTPYSDFSGRQNCTFPHSSYPDKCADFQLKSLIEVNTILTHLLNMLNEFQRPARKPLFCAIRCLYVSCTYTFLQRQIITESHARLYSITVRQEMLLLLITFVASFHLWSESLKFEGRKWYQFSLTNQHELPGMHSFGSEVYQTPTLISLHFWIQNGMHFLFLFFFYL